MTFNFITNKHPGACAYCTKRVGKGDGIWLDGVWHVAHSECLSGAFAKGRGPDVADPASTPARALKAAREIMRTVRMDMSGTELDAAWAALCALVEQHASQPRTCRAYLEGEAVPF